MRLAFTFSDSPDLKVLSKHEIYTTSIQLPEQTLALLGVEQRVLEVARLVSCFTAASLHLSCRELGIANQLINVETVTNRNYSVQDQQCAMFIQFAGTPQAHYHKRRQQSAVLKILAPKFEIFPRQTLSPRFSPRTRGAKKARNSLSNNLWPIDIGWGRDGSQAEDGEMLQQLVLQLDVLLNASPDIQWICRGYNPSWADKTLFEQQKKRRNALRKEHLAQELAVRQAELDAANQNAKPPENTGKGRRPGAIPGEFMGVMFRSQLEIRFATELQSRGIRWQYEIERLGTGNYLVDFYLPDLGIWVEVKGKFEPRDNYLLLDVAQQLTTQRQESLYVYTSGHPLRVTADGYEKINRQLFWAELQDADDS